MTYIRRQLQDTIQQLSQQFGVILLTGPRQVGKTTLLTTLMQQEKIDRHYVTLDDLELRRLAKEDPALFLQIHKPPLLIDEVQYAPELFPYIKMYVDRTKEKGAFWLTGSQIFKLMRGVQESLAGRVALLNLFALSQAEIEQSRKTPFTLALTDLTTRPHTAKDIVAVFQALWQGGMPALISGEVTNRDVFYSSYLSTYIDRDVRELSKEIESLKFLKFVTSVAARTGQLINVKAIADDANITVVTANNWLNILETLGLIFYLHPYANNVLKRTIKKPKLYFTDTGLVCYLTKWSSAEVAMNGAMSSALFENYIVSEIMKSYYYNGLTPYIYYYRDRDDKEIDLIIEKDGLIHPIEIKKTGNPEKRMMQAFTVLNKAGIKQGTGALICLAGQLGAFDETHLIVPCSYI